MKLINSVAFFLSMFNGAIAEQDPEVSKVFIQIVFSLFEYGSEYNEQCFYVQ